ncbi:MAG: peptidoglycan/xylan/chitin deacetylase (PgdA/CDA1 family) [Bradymonadia bacterium]|jgi:peptidoglycan/xylan/chitin deacetylase (PgdA/CDA1 family)
MDAKRQAKTMLGRLMYASGRHRPAFEQRSVITCFHSINDDQSSPVACTSAQFEEYCSFFKKYFDTISLTALLDRLAAEEDISGTAVITFDDGYLDNFELGAPILEKYGLPATFFVATDFIGSEHQAWWDSDCDISSKWMSWDNVRGLSDAGFELGAHTCSHANLGKIPLSEAKEEIDGSVAAIEQETGKPTTLFAYPFGGIDNMTPEVREHIRISGLRCCPSSYGGLVSPQTDPFDLPRLPIINWYQSAYQFGFEASRLRDKDFVPHQSRSTPD